MGTKKDPGPYDCYANAAEDEPMFILLARDKHAPGLVKEWANKREAAGEDPAKVQEARDCAKAMREWREKTKGKETADLLRYVLDHVRTRKGEDIRFSPPFAFRLMRLEFSRPVKVREIAVANVLVATDWLLDEQDRFGIQLLSKDVYVETITDLKSPICTPNVIISLRGVVVEGEPGPLQITAYGADASVELRAG